VEARGPSSPSALALQTFVKLMRHGKLSVVCQISQRGLQAGTDEQRRGLDRTAALVMNSIPEPKRRHRMDLMPDVNSGKEWAPMDLADLQNALAQGYGMEVIAQFLCRDVEEVRGKMGELEFLSRLQGQGSISGSL
jgi:hypothetical protein